MNIDGFFVFVHIQKTAGTAFRKCFLEKVFSKNEIYRFYGKKRFLTEYLTVLKCKAIVGHMPADIHKMLPKVRYYSIVRDPVERAISNYDYIMPPTARYTHPDWNEINANTIDQFYQLPYRDNAMTRCLSGCSKKKVRCDRECLELAIENINKRFIDVGITELMPGSMNKLSEAVGLDPESIELKVVRTRDERSKPKLKKADLSERTLREITRSHEWDIRLYEHIYKQH